MSRSCEDENCDFCGGFEVKRRYTEKELFEKVQMEIERLGSQKAFAEAIGVSPSFVNDVWMERRNPGSQRILDFLGLRKIPTPVLYEEK